MTWLKLIANALWPAVYGALLVAFLFFFLNDELSAAGVISRPFGVTLAWSLLLYTPIFALLFPTLYVCLRFFAARKLQMPWLSLKTIVWFGIVILLTMTIVYYRNLRLSGALLSPSARDALRILCAVMAGCWILALAGAVAAQRRPQGRRTTHRVTAGLLILIPGIVMCLMAPWMAPDTPAEAGRPLEAASVRAASPGEAVTGRTDAYGPHGPEQRLLLIALDTATMDFILPLVSARQLPTFERLIKEGASTRLDAFRPCSSSAAWATVMTGMPPWITGVRGRRTFMLLPGAPSGGSFSIVPGALGISLLAQAGFLASQPSPAGGGKRPTLSRVLEAQSIPVSMFGWPDRYQGEEPASTVPAADIRIRARLEKIMGPEGESATVEAKALAALLRKAIAIDLSARDAADGNTAGARLLGVRFAGLARVSRAVLRYHLPDEYGDVSQREIAAFGPILTRYYQFLDDLIADLIKRQETNGRLLHIMVVSAHGIAPTSGWERFITPMISSRRRITPIPSGTWADGPDGLLLVHGPGVRPGVRLEDAALTDVMPTALYLLGSPVGHDLKGQLLRRFFEREYLESHPVQIVHVSGANTVAGF